VVTVEPLLGDDIEPIPFDLRVRDRRQEVDHIGLVKDQWDVATAYVRSDAPATEWMHLCLRNHLEESGLLDDASPTFLGGIRLDVGVRRIFVEGYWVPEAELVAEIEVTRFGETFVKQKVHGLGAASMPRPGGTAGYQIALEEAMKALLTELVPIAYEALWMAERAGPGGNPSSRFP
jgi:hypothetical protein